MSITSLSASYDSTDNDMRERIEESDTLNSCELLNLIFIEIILSLLLFSAHLDMTKCVFSLEI